MAIDLLNNAIGQSTNATQSTLVNQLNPTIQPGSNTQLKGENVETSSLNEKPEKSQQEKRDCETSMKSISKDINKIINRNTVAEFGFYESTNKIIIKIKDKNTNEVIKEIPSEKALELLEKALEFAGILVDEKR